MCVCSCVRVFVRVCARVCVYVCARDIKTHTHTHTHKIQTQKQLRTTRDCRVTTKRRRGHKEEDLKRNHHAHNDAAPRCAVDRAGGKGQWKPGTLTNWSAGDQGAGSSDGRRAVGTGNDENDTRTHPVPWQHVEQLRRRGTNTHRGFEPPLRPRC